MQNFRACIFPACVYPQVEPKPEGRDSGECLCKTLEPVFSRFVCTLKWSPSPKEGIVVSILSRKGPSFAEMDRMRVPGHR